jgi:DNA-binding IclR family transcriptional regulator
VLDHARHPVAAVAVTYPDDAARDRKQIIGEITRTARALGRRVGGPVVSSTVSGVRTPSPD